MTVYASTTGSALNPIPAIGTPWPLAVALTSARIVAGATVYIRGGTYSGDIDATIGGASGTPITIKPYPGETPIINGRLRIYGNDTTWQDLEVCYTGWTTRQSAFDGLNPPDVPGYDKTLEIRGPRTKILSCKLHDLGECELWEVAPDTTFAGNIIWNNGFQQATAGGVDQAVTEIHTSGWDG